MKCIVGLFESFRKFVGAAVALVAAATAAPGQDRHALLIGIDSYPGDPGVRKLRFAEKDASDLHELLKDQEEYLAEEPLLGRTADRQGILMEFARLVREVKPDDTFLLYFAGHGVRHNGHTYWLTPRANLSLLDDQGIRLSHLLDSRRSH